MGTKRYLCSHCNYFVTRGTRSRHLNEITATSEASCETDATDLEENNKLLMMDNFKMQILLFLIMMVGCCNNIKSGRF